jgi:hypothetical protein
MFKRDMLIILLMTFITIAAWIGFNIYHIIVTSTISEELQAQITAINPNFDLDTINKLKSRKSIEPLYQITDTAPKVTATPSAAVTFITPGITPTESPAVIQGGP